MFTYHWQVTCQRAVRLPLGVRAVVADGYLWYRHRKGFKDAALPYVTNVWLRTRALIWSGSKTQCLFLRIRLICAPESLRSMCTPLKSFRVMLLDNAAMWASYMKRKKKRLKDAKSITLGVCALRCHLLHVNQQWSRRGRRRGGSGTLSWKTASGAKASTAHITPSIACPHCAPLELLKALFGKQNYPCSVFWQQSLSDA